MPRKIEVDEEQGRYMDGRESPESGWELKTWLCLYSRNDGLGWAAYIKCLRSQCMLLRITQRRKV